MHQFRLVTAFWNNSSSANFEFLYIPILGSHCGLFQRLYKDEYGLCPANPNHCIYIIQTLCGFLIWNGSDHNLFFFFFFFSLSMSVAVRLATNYEELADEALLPFYCQNTLFASLLNNFLFLVNIIE